MNEEVESDGGYEDGGVEKFDGVGGYQKKKKEMTILVLHFVANTAGATKSQRRGPTDGP